MLVNRISIPAKLACVGSILLIPTIILAWLFIQQSAKDISFAEKEIAGVAYLKAAFPVFRDLILSSNDKDASRAAPDALAALRASHDAAMNTGVTAKDLEAVLSTLGWPNKAIGRSAESSHAIATARTLITKIADGSNLTLDPDLDSYYVMDVVTVRVTDAYAHLGDLIALAREHREKASLSDDDKAEIMIKIGQFQTASSDAISSLNAAYRGNSSGAVRQALESRANDFARLSAELTTGMKSLATEFRNDTARSKSDLSKVNALYRETAKSADQLWQAGAIELQRLLNVRVSALKANLWSMLGLAGAILLVAFGFSFVIVRGITRPLQAMTGAMSGLAAGNLATSVVGLGRMDEIGAMASAVQVFKDSMIETDRLRAEQAEAEKHAVRERSEVMRRLANEFEATVSEIIETVSHASTELEASATTLTKTADLTQQRSAMVAAASEEASANVQSVASATEEMSSSVAEIGRQVEESTRIADEAVNQAKKTDDRINALSQAAGRIGDVVNLITSIAEQTNLLALNATIEAARAGDAGRGFAVVAQEVKALAAQTAKATQEIESQISSMQTATQESVQAIKDIGTTIGRVSEIASAIAAAVEEQGAATQEIARNVQQAAAGTTQVAASISDVNQGANETGTASSQVLSSAQSLSSESNRLKSEVANFLSTVRAA